MSSAASSWTRGKTRSRRRQGILLLQTKSVLRGAVRLLQLFQATLQRRPIVCVNVLGGGYDFAKAKALLLSLSTELPVGQMVALRTELVAQDLSVAKLASSLSRTVPSSSMKHLERTLPPN